jgi:hypothetical protein
MKPHWQLMAKTKNERRAIMGALNHHGELSMDELAKVTGMSQKRTAEEWGRLAVSLPGWRWMPGMAILTVGGVIDRIAAIDETYIHAWAESQQQENPRGLWLRYRRDRMDKHGVPFADDPATEGCMVRLLGPVHEAVWYTGDCDRWVVAVGEERRLYTSLGRACIAAAAALGRWPNVAECGPKGAE